MLPKDLVIRSAAPSDAPKNQVWTEIKSVDETYSDLSANITIDPSLPAPKPNVISRDRY